MTILIVSSRSLNDLNITFPSPVVDWTPEDGYPPDAPSDGFPWRPKGNKKCLAIQLFENITTPRTHYCFFACT